ncbi:MAG: putative bifunctional diguanylate cyclase/phosphodiesterase [Shimia sp.]
MGVSDGQTGAATRALQGVLCGPHVLAFLPASTLAAFWLGGERALVVLALVLPLLYAIAAGVPALAAAQEGDVVRNLGLRDRLIDALDQATGHAHGADRTAICFVLEIDDLKLTEERFGRRAAEHILRRTAERMADALRDYDTIARIDPTTFAIATSPMRMCDLETAIQMASRLQRAVQEPISIDATRVHVSASVGFCLSSRAPEPTGQSVLDAATAAMVEARRAGPSAIRAYSDEMRARIDARHTLIEDAAQALDAGDIHPWFQPQVSTETGRITGFEALARWKHPTRGLVSPAEFLPAVEQAGLMERLGEAILDHALAALRHWDQSGVRVPSVGVNFSSEELRNPALVEKVKWELDRYEMAPDRLSIEVLESVVALTDDDMIVRNIAGLAQLGCRIDLDDFGTGHASISSIRRFSINRLKIDRSFVMKVDEDREQQKMVAAILLMAERLGLETLAEGVETLGEHAILSQLGCGHVQGYGLARPMPFDETLAWIDRHEQKLSGTANLMRRPAQGDRPN